MTTKKDKIKETMVSLKYLNLMIEKAIQLQKEKIIEEIEKINLFDLTSSPRIPYP